MLSSRKSSAPVSGAYTLSKSVRLRSSASAYLNRTPASATNRKTWTWSGWIKFGRLTGYSYIFGATSDAFANNFFLIQINNSASTMALIDYNSAYSIQLIPTQIFADPSAWYHIVFAVDTTQSTASNRAKLYVNGNQVTNFTTATYPSLNSNTNVNNNILHTLGYSTYGMDGYLADVYLIDGQQLTPSSFGSTNATTGQWSPAKYSGSYGTNGFHLTFANTTSTTTLGYDTSGNSNNWTTNNISLTAGSTYDSMNDVPVAYSATAANWCVLNPNDKSNASLVISDGNLSYSGTGGWWCVRSSFGMTTGKWYCEVKITGGGSPYNTIIGLMTSQSNLFSPSDSYPGLDAYGWGYYGSSGNIYNNGSHTAYGSAFGNGDTIGIAFDAGAGSLTFYYDGTSQGVAFTGLTSGPYYFAFSQVGANGSVNFGQQPFTYTPPSGYKGLNTYNLPTPAIAQGNKYMDATTYTGSGSARSVTNAGGFQPDLVWAKGRSVSYDNEWYDSVRGATKRIISNSTGAEATVSGVTAFNSNGFSLGSDTGTNQSSQTFVAWQWQAGAGTTSSNTNGTITSTVSVNTTAGFSILSYAGGQGANFTIGHGLSTAPSLIIAKSRSATADWGVYYTVNGVNTNYMVLDTTAAQGSNGGTLAGGAYLISNSTTLQVGQTSFANSASSMIAYCWIPIAGFSAFGSYTGNGSSSGPFIYTGFKPKYVLIKRTDSTSDWSILDATRNPYNSLGEVLNADTSGVGNTYTALNFLSNGFNFVWSDSSMNASGGTYIYAAFASNPFQYSNAF